MREEAIMATPFTGLTVLDFSSGMAGSLCTLVLADFGAEVVKVEPPNGDPYRSTPAWLGWNRGKESIVLDLNTAEGRQQAQHLAARADVLVESFRPGDTVELGIDYESLAHINPRLVYCSITGFGQKGPLRRIQGYEGVVAARAGRMLNLAGQPRRDGPVYSTVQTGSWHTSQAAIRGIIGALRVRDLTGNGQWVQTSIVRNLGYPHDFNAGGGALVPMQLTKKDPVRWPPPREDIRGLSSIGYVPVRTKDGKWLQHGNQRDHHTEGHLRVIGLGKVLDEDPRFKKINSLSPENREILRRMILEAQAQKTADEWMELYIKDGNIAAEPYRHSAEGLTHSGMVKNNHVVEIQDPRVGPMKQIGLLVDLKDTPGKVGGPAPDLGQHTESVIERLSQRPVSNPNSAPKGTYINPPSSPAHPLDGVTILDVGTIQAGPLGCTFLADLGARVIKVDATDVRVDERQRPSGTAISEPRTYAGKECIRIDLQTPEGKEIMHNLISKADVLFHNFRLGVPERLKVDFATCHQINPRLVHVWMATYGEHSEHARRPGAHPIPGAIMGGPMRQMGHGMPPPPETQLDMEELVEATRWIMRANWGPDQNTSGAVATAIALGLRARDLNGVGQAVHVAMICANAYTNADEAYDYEGRPPYSVPDSEIHGLHALYRLYRAKEGWVFLGCLYPSEWKAFCHAVGRDDLHVDPRFSSPEARQQNNDTLIEEISRIFATRSAPDWESSLTAADVACVQADAAVEGEFYLSDPHALENNLSVEVEHPLVGTYRRYGGMVEFSATPGVYRTATQAGQHTDAILGELAYNIDQIQDFRDRSVVQ